MRRIIISIEDNVTDEHALKYVKRDLDIMKTSKEKGYQETFFTYWECGIKVTRRRGDKTKAESFIVSGEYKDGFQNLPRHDEL